MQNSPPHLQEILPGLHVCRSRLSGPHHPVNSYWLQTAQGVLLIDPAQEVTPPGINLHPTAILITHVQEEHSAGASNFPDVPVYVPAGDEYLCAGEQSYKSRITAWEPPWDWETRGNFEGHLSGASNERPPLNPLPVAGSLRDGDELFGLRVLSTPGHGKNALTFVAHHEGRRIAFCGDLIYDQGHLWNWFDCDWDYGTEAGQRALLHVAQRRRREALDLLCPAHGPAIENPQQALDLLCARLSAVLCRPDDYDYTPINFPDRDSPADGWRELSPHLHQWRTGNCAAIISQTGSALLVDDGLCHWVPEPQRSEHHRKVIANLRSSLGISRIEVCIPTHYHGDHVENIPDLVSTERAQVLCLDTVAKVLEQPKRFNLACELWWYGTTHDTIPIHRRVESGTTYQWHEYELEVFHLGGQTFYHAGIAANVDGKRVLFCGDAISGWNPAPDPVLSWNDCTPRTRGWAYSLARMIERGPDLLVCGHGSAIRDPMPLLHTKRAHWQRRMAEYSALNARGDDRLFFDPFIT